MCSRKPFMSGLMHLKLKDGQKGCDLFLMTANLHSDMARVGARWMCNAAMLSLTWPRHSEPGCTQAFG